MSTDGTGWEISPIFAHRNAAKQTVRRPQKSEEKALKPSGFKAFSVAGAEGLEVASQPRLRCPKRPMLAFTRAVSTAAPTPARCIRHRRREQAPACGARNGRCSLSLAPFRPLRQPLLAVSATGGARRRCPARGFGAAVGKRKNTSNSAVLRRLPSAKIVFDAILMLLSFQLRKRSRFAPE